VSDEVNKEKTSTNQEQTMQTLTVKEQKFFFRDDKTGFSLERKISFLFRYILLYFMPFVPHTFIQLFDDILDSIFIS
jgi:hypothetical protein